MPDSGTDISKIDVFVSYAQEDLPIVKPIVDRLTARGLRVWWDRERMIGQRWRSQIEQHLDAARHVLVVWTTQSSRPGSFVREEAQFAVDCNKLLHICVGRSRPPFGFNEFHFEVLPPEWNGNADHPAFQGLLASLLGTTQGAAVPAAQAATSPTGGPGLQARQILGDARGLADAVAAAAIAFDKVALSTTTAALVSELPRSSTGLTVPDAIELLTTLRNVRAHEQVVAIAEQLLSSGITSERLRRLFAQSLIDLDRLNCAIGVLREALDSIQRDHEEYSELVGLLGRAHKQIYVNDKRRPVPESSARALRIGYGDYNEALGGKPLSNIDGWLGINLIAIQAMADRDGIDLYQSLVEPERDARIIIQDLERIPNKVPFVHASLGEAYVVIKQWEKAAEHFGRFIGHPNTTIFQINSALRQLKEVWQLKPGPDGPGQLLLGLEARLISASGGAVHLRADELRASQTAAAGNFARPVFDKVLGETIRGPGEDINEALPETIVGDHKARPIEWLRMALERAASVGRVKIGYKTVGTGFVVRGRDLSDHLGDELFFLTNSHVVSAGRAGEGLQRIGMSGISPARPDQISIVFDAAEGQNAKAGRRCKLIWESPVAELDAALLRFAEPLVGVAPCPIAAAMPNLKVNGYRNALRNSRVFVIGHPQGGSLSISIEDCDLIDRGAKSSLGAALSQIEFLHYRTPTEPGSSGSPVLEELGWEVVALHHFGGSSRTGTITCLDGQKQHQANEGISILSIASAIRTQRPALK